MLDWLRRDIGALQGIPPTLTSEQKLERFLTQPALRRGVAVSTQNQVSNTVALFYRNVLGTPLHDMDAFAGHAARSLASRSDSNRDPRLAASRR